MTRIIAISNYKGGVAKTTTTINLGAALVREGKKVLLVDIDPQCNLTETMYKGKTEETVYTAMTEGKPVTPIKLKDNFYMIPSDKKLNAFDVNFGSVDGSRVWLRKVLGPLRGTFDFILIDCPPSRSIVAVNALSVADEVIIPMQAEILSVRGTKDMNELIEVVRDKINPKLKLAGLLITLYGDRTSAARQTAVYIEEMAKLLGTKVFRARIRKNVTIVESQMAGVDVYEINAQAKAAQDYVELAKEVLEG